MSIDMLWGKKWERWLTEGQPLQEKKCGRQFVITFLIVYHRFSPFFTVSHHPLHSLRPFHLWVRHAKCTWSSSLSLLLSSSTKFADPLKALIFSTSRDRLLLSNFTPRLCYNYNFAFFCNFVFSIFISTPYILYKNVLAPDYPDYPLNI